MAKRKVDPVATTSAGEILTVVMGRKAFDDKREMPFKKRCVELLGDDSPQADKVIQEFLMRGIFERSAERLIRNNRSTQLFVAEMFDEAFVNAYGEKVLRVCSLPPGLPEVAQAHIASRLGRHLLGIVVAKMQPKDLTPAAIALQYEQAWVTVITAKEIANRHSLTLADAMSLEGVNFEIIRRVELKGRESFIADKLKSFEFIHLPETLMKFGDEFQGVLMTACFEGLKLAGQQVNEDDLALTLSGFKTTNKMKWEMEEPELNRKYQIKLVVYKAFINQEADAIFG